MSFGGGTFTTQNKVLPGTYINFVSAKSGNVTLSDRGVATMPLELDWGIDGEVFTVTAEDFQKKSKTIFGYEYTHEKLKGLRDLFLNITILHAYKINTGGAKASNTFAEAKYTGIRGNDIKIAIAENIDDSTKFDVSTFVDNQKIDTQTVASATDLVANDWVSFKNDATLEVTASTSLANGTNGTVNGTSYQTYLDKIESYSFNTMGVVTTDDTTKSLVAAFCKRLRDEMGIKFQVVLHQKSADYMGVINVENSVTDTGLSEASLVYWVTGASAGCAVNKSLQNRKYDGEFSVNTEYTQSQLKQAITDGKFVLHRSDSDIRVLDDINSMTTVTDDVGEVFKSNQTIRVIDQLANDDAVLFNTKYIGVVPNNDAGRTSLWLDLVKIRQQLQSISAIQNFEDDDLSVERGNDNKSVVVNYAVEVVNSMSKLYMTARIS